MVWHTQGWRINWLNITWNTICAWDELWNKEGHGRLENLTYWARVKVEGGCRLCKSLSWIVINAVITYNKSNGRTAAEGRWRKEVDVREDIVIIVKWIVPSCSAKIIIRIIEEVIRRNVKVIRAFKEINGVSSLIELRLTTTISFS